MIRLVKLDCPSVLALNAEEWTHELLEAQAAGDPDAARLRLRYRDPSIKATLVQETAGKCAYCESKLRHVIPGDTEHIAPSSKRPELTFAWENLTLVCVECNRNKLDYYSDSPPSTLVNPYLDEPSEHLRFFGPSVFHLTPDRGYLTRQKLKLDRAELIDRRRQRLEAVHHLLDLWRRAPEGEVKAQLREDLLAETERECEFSAAVRDFLRAQPDFAL